MFTFDNQRHYPKLLCSKAIIRFQDCDPLRHLNNAKYFDYYFNAREDQMMKHYNMTSSDVYQRYRATWVIYNHNISYVRSAMVGEVVCIYSHIIHFDNDTITTEFFMTDAKGQMIKNLLWTTSKFIDVASGKRIPHPEDVQAFLTSIHSPVAGFPGLTPYQRLQQLKQQLGMLLSERC